MHAARSKLIKNKTKNISTIGNTKNMEVFKHSDSAIVCPKSFPFNIHPLNYKQKVTNK